VAARDAAFAVKARERRTIYSELNGEIDGVVRPDA
jgi:hypothetical protein